MVRYYRSGYLGSEQSMRFRGGRGGYYGDSEFDGSYRVRRGANYNFASGRRFGGTQQFNRFKRGGRGVAFMGGGFIGRGTFGGGWRGVPARGQSLAGFRFRGRGASFRGGSSRQPMMLNNRRRGGGWRRPRSEGRGGRGGGAAASTSGGDMATRLDDEIEKYMCNGDDSKRHAIMNDQLAQYFSKKTPTSTACDEDTPMMTA